MTETRSWRVRGMHCSSCGIAIDEAVEEVAGVASSTTSMKKQVTTVTFDPATCTADQVARAIIEAGYQISPAADTETKPRRSWFRRPSP